MTFGPSARHDRVGPRRRRGGHHVRRRGLDNPSRDRLTFFDSRRRAARSGRFRTGISRSRRLAPRRQKNPCVSVQSRGQVGLFRLDGGRNRIYSASAIRSCYGDFHGINFVSMHAAAPTAGRRRRTRINGLCSCRARGHRRFGMTVLVCATGTGLACVRASGSPRESAAARCHSVFGVV